MLRLLRSLIAFGLYPLIVVLVSHRNVNIMVEGDSIDGLEKTIDLSWNSEVNSEISTSEADVEKLREQLELCLADYSVLNKRLHENEMDQLTSNKKISDGFFKQFVRHFLEKMSCLDKECPEPSDIVYIYLTPENIDTLYKYVTGKGDTSDALYVMKYMIQGVQLTEYTSYRDRMLTAFGVDETQFKVIVAVAVSLICCVVFQMKTSLSWLNQLLIVFVFVFLISIPWNWLQLYQEKLAERHAEMIKQAEIPEFCRSEAKPTVFKSIRNFFKKITSVKDECKEYHKKYMVDPILEVSPIKAVAKTCAVLLFAPAGELGKAVADFHTEFLGNMPKLIWIPALISWLAILAVVLLTLYFGCSSKSSTVHHVRDSVPPSPSRQMIEQIVQEQLRQEQYIDYSHQKYPSPGLPPVTLRARGHATLQELEYRNRRGYRAISSQDYPDNASSPGKSDSEEKLLNVEKAEEFSNKIVKEVIAQLKIDSEEKDNSSSAIDDAVFRNKTLPIQEKKEFQDKKIPEACTLPSCVKASSSEDPESINNSDDESKGKMTEIDESSSHLSDDNEETINDIQDDNNEEDDFVVLQSTSLIRPL